MGIEQWDAYNKFIEGGLKEGQYITGQFVLIAAGPPHLKNFGGAAQLGQPGDVVYPIGVTQNLAVSQNRGFTRIFEMSGERSYFVPGRTVGQLTLARVWLHGGSLLRTLYAYYQDTVGDYQVQAMYDSSAPQDETLWPWGTGGNRLDGLHNVRIPAGYENMFLNLSSDLFSQPIGLLLLVRDTDEQNVGAIYFEQCVVPTHTWTVDSQGLIVQESVGIQYERMVPIRINAVSLIRDSAFGEGSANPFASLPQASV